MSRRNGLLEWAHSRGRRPGAAMPSDPRLAPLDVVILYTGWLVISLITRDSGRCFAEGLSEFFTLGQTGIAALSVN